jgi:hypothetical protein
MVVTLAVPKHWTVVFDPQPQQIIGQTAFFPVQIKSGEVVRLHVGLRHSSPMCAKTIRARGGTQAGLPTEAAQGNGLCADSSSAHIRQDSR